MTPTNIPTPDTTQPPPTIAFTGTLSIHSDGSVSCIPVPPAVPHAAPVNPVVIPPDPGMAAIFGPLIRYGSNPWPYADTCHKAMADHFGGLLATKYLDWWNHANAGTVSLTTGSTKVKGIGTKFQTDFCGGAGKTTPADPGGIPNGNPGGFLVVWNRLWPNVTYFGRIPTQVASCEAEDLLTLSQPWQGDNLNAQYSLMTWTQAYLWMSYTSGADDVDYYDDVMAYYSLWLRGGGDQYLGYARTLADRWWSQPWLDEGRGTFMDGQPRGQSLTGMFVRCLDGRPEMWNGLRLVVDRQRPKIRTTSAPSDPREDGYKLSEVALCAMLDPDPVHKAACQADLAYSIRNQWAPAQQGNGAIHTISNGWGPPWNGPLSTVAVKRGSAIVVGTNTDWVKRGMPVGGTPPQDFWTFDLTDPSSTAILNPDTTFYHVLSIEDDTHLTLDKPYVGLDAATRYYQYNTWLGYGLPPYMVGIVGTALHYSEMALRGFDDPAADLAKSILIKLADWVISHGYDPNTGGLYFAADFPNCVGIPGNPNCVWTNKQESRELNAEVLNLIAQAYRYTGSPRFSGFADALYAALFGQSGPYADPDYSRAIGPDGYYIAKDKAKYLGYIFGFGQAAEGWPAMRLG